MSTPDSTTILRRCTKCGIEKPETLEYFRRDKKGRNGFHSWCIACLNATSKAHYAANREARVQYRRDYVEANKETVLESTRASYHKHREQYLEDKKRYVAENPEKLREHWRRMHKMRYYAPGSHTKEQELELLFEQDDRCGYCGITLHGEYAPDHKMPVARGGSHDIENITVCCADCNNTKHTSTIEEWEKRRGW